MAHTQESSSPELDNPHFTFAGEFMTAYKYEVPDDPALAAMMYDPSRYRLKSQASMAQPFCYYVGTHMDEYRPISGSRLVAGGRPIDFAGYNQRRVAGILNEVLGAPIVDKEVIESRSEIIHGLSSSQSLPDIIQSMKGVYGLTSSLSALLDYRSPSEDRGDLGHFFGPRTERMLLEEYFAGREGKDAMKLALEPVDTGNSELGALAHRLGALGGEVFDESAANLAKLSESIGSVLCAKVLDAAKVERDGVDANNFLSPISRALSGLLGYELGPSRYYSDDVFDDHPQPGIWVGNVLARVDEMMAVVSLSRIVGEEGWPRSLPGPELDRRRVWNLSKPRSDQHDGEGLFNAGKQVVVLVAPNGAGKTYAIERDVGGVLSQQTFGCVPAKTPNKGGPITYEPNTAFTILGRFNSFGWANRGELVNELERWKEVLRDMGDHPIFYLDEAISTASPIGQAALNLAFAGYVQEKGGRVCLATHNEHVGAFVAEEQDDIDAALYTFEPTEDNPYSMREGVSDSGFNDVVRSGRLGAHYASLVDRYLDGGLGIDYAPAYPEVPAGYSEEQRNSMMNRRGGLAYMFPETVNSPAFVPLSNDSGLISGGGTELPKLLYRSDPVAFAEILERQRSINELSAYEEIDDWRDALRLLSSHLGPYLTLIQVPGPVSVLEGLNPVTQADEVWITTDEMHDDIDVSLPDKMAAYIGLLQGLFPDHQLGDVLLELGSVGPEIDALRAEHNEEVDTLQDGMETSRREMLEAEKRHLGQVEKLVKGAVNKALCVIEELDFEGLELQEFWRDDSNAELIQRLTGPHVYYISGNDAEDGVDDAADRDTQFDPTQNSYQGSEYIASLLLEEEKIIGALSRVEHHADLIDSVHIRQGVSHLLEQANGYLEVSAEQPPLVGHPAPWHSRYSPTSTLKSAEDSFWDFEPQRTTQATMTVNQLTLFTDLAQKVASGQYSIAEFNATGTVELDGVQSIYKDQKHQPFDYAIEQEHAGVAFSGEHSMGKTYSTRHVANALLLAMKLGVVPARRGKMPYFERIGYIDRVAQEMGAPISSGQQEADVWADHEEIMSSAKTAITFADEVGSSTSPKYQAALAATMMASAARRGHRMVITTHHDGLLEFANGSPGLTVHAIEMAKDGQRVIRPNTIISNPISFAEQVGLPERLVELAKYYYDLMLAKQRDSSSPNLEDR
jgi:hypothetical protein